MGINGQSCCRPWLALLLALGSAVGAWAEPASDAEALIALARQQLGGDAVLESVNSLVYKGSIEFFDSATRGEVRIYLQKPDFQRMEVELEEGLQVVALDDLQGWEMIVDKRTNPPTPQARYLNAKEFWRNHFSAVENLWFHHGYRKSRGHLEWSGESVMDGRRVGSITVRYDADNVVLRSFELDTGILVRSVGNDGTEVREREWIVVSGIRFPKVAEYYSNGIRSSRLTFDVIEVNPQLDPALFRYPVF